MWATDPAWPSRRHFPSPSLGLVLGLADPLPKKKGLQLALGTPRRRAVAVDVVVVAASGVAAAAVGAVVVAASGVAAAAVGAVAAAAPLSAMFPLLSALPPGGCWLRCCSCCCLRTPFFFKLLDFCLRAVYNWMNTQHNTALHWNFNPSC